MLAGLLTLAACSFGKDVGATQEAVGAFHQAYNAGNIGKIYDDSSEAMKSNTTAADLARVFDTLHRKLGAYKSSNSVGWNENMNTNGTVVTVDYAGTYERGKTEERFQFLIVNGKPKLLNFNINSPALLEKDPAPDNEAMPAPGANQSE